MALSYFYNSEFNYEGLGAKLWLLFWTCALRLAPIGTTGILDDYEAVSFFEEIWKGLKDCLKFFSKVKLFHMRRKWCFSFLWEFLRGNERERTAESEEGRKRKYLYFPKKEKGRNFWVLNQEKVVSWSIRRESGCILRPLIDNWGS